MTDTFSTSTRATGALPTSPFSTGTLAATSDRARLSATLTVGDDGRWFRLSERREVSLERRAALRRILAALARQRVDAPGTALPLDSILEAGWPGERVSVEAGAARVYNAIQRLRRLGLENVLRTRDDGYLLDAETSTSIAGGADRS